MKLKTVNISDLKPRKSNPNTHPIEQLNELQNSLEQFDQVKNIVVWQDKVIAGCGLLEAAKKQGRSQIEVQDVSDWPEEKAIKFMIADNRLAEIAIMDDDILAGLLKDLGDPFDVPGIDEAFLDELGFEDEAGGEGETDPDEIPEDVEPVVKSGELWLLENHRLLCGDATKKEDVERLMDGKKADMFFTDPPFDFKADFLGICFDFIDKGHLFVMDSDKNHATNTGKYIKYFNVFYVIFFKSPTWNLSKKIPLTQHLLIAHYRTENVKNRELKMLHSVIEVSTKNDRSVKQYVAKRQEIIIPFIENFSDKQNIVLDPFCGAGSILIACEELNRRFFGIEVDPKCCDITIKRWEDFSGKKATLSTNK
jgi:DNA modification methylase